MLKERLGRKMSNRWSKVELKKVLFMKKKVIALNKWQIKIEFNKIMSNHIKKVKNIKMHLKQGLDLFVHLLKND